MVSIRLPQVLRKYAADLDFVEVTATTVAEALEAAVAAHPDLEIRLLDTDGRFHSHLLLFVDGEQVAREDHATRPVDAGARIDVLMSIVGGAA
jgi:sulfur carrier protein ThiS